MDIIFIIAQIFGFIAFCFSLFAYHKKTKKKILFNMILSSSLNLIHYFLLGAYSGCITKIIAILRDSFIIKKETNKKLNKNHFLYIFIIIYIIIGFIMYENILSIFPIIAATIYLIPIWNGKPITVKKAAFICYFLWLIYNIFVLSISGIISNIVSIISTHIAIKNFKKEKK